jgi:hypothetical protein
MSADSSYVLKHVIEKSRLQDKPGWKADEYFELFAAQQTLKLRRFNLDPTEIESGVVGGGGDAGVDGFYVFVNKKFVREDTDPMIFKDQQLNFELVILQAKNTTSFEESVPQKLKDFAEQCLPMGSTLGEAQQKLFGEPLLTAVKTFHDIYELGLLKQPKLTIFYAHVSLGEQIDPKVDIRRDFLVAKTREIFTTAEVHYAYLTGSKLLTLFNQHPEETIPLVTQEYFDSKLHERSGYICLATLPDFYDFIADKDVLQEHLFEANVRAHAPDVKVNKGISTTLANPAQEDFWWLNNGITILASAVVYNDRKLHVTNPLVVNGLQTSYELFNHFSAGASRDDKRTILIRVIVIDTESATSDKIITATNSQTKIEAINLHATEQIQRHIEMALKTHGLYYDRRKNYYRNQGISVQKIVTIGSMAQAVAAIVLQQPDNARARPTTVAEKNYSALFSEKAPLPMYPKCAMVIKRVDAYLDGLSLARSAKLNLLFYVSMHSVCSALKSIRPNRKSIADMDVDLLTDHLVGESYKKVLAYYTALGGDDQVAKGPELIKRLKADLVATFGGQKKKVKSKAKLGQHN